MTMTETQAFPDPATYARDRDALLDKVLRAVDGAFEVYALYIGERLGYYRALAAAGDAGRTAATLAEATSTHPRYAREWLEQQAVTGVVIATGDGRFRLPAAHAEVLTERDSLNYIAPLARVFVGAAKPIDRVLDAFRNGGGVPFGDYGADLREGQAEVNRAAFLRQLGPEWLASVADVDALLRDATRPARVADIGCGAGYSSIGIATAYPHARVYGFDTDAPSIELARANAREAEVEERVTFLCRDAAAPGVAGGYDLAIALECVHDMGNPVGALTAMRLLTRPDGAVIVVDERVGDHFAPGGTAATDVEAMMYGWSLLHCLPACMADGPDSAATGTVMRADTLRRYATGAGFTSLDILPIENHFFRFYRLRH